MILNYIYFWSVSNWVPQFLGVSIIEPHRGMLSQNYITYWKKQGYLINAWTINNSPTKKYATHLHISYTTNCPGLNISCQDTASDQM